jgi:hypothetical protein
MFETTKKVLWGLLIAYFFIAAYHNVRAEVREWAGYETCNLGE